MVITIIIVALVSLLCGYFLGYTHNGLDQEAVRKAVENSRDAEVVVGYLVGRNPAPHEVQTWAKAIRGREVYAENRQALENLIGLYELGGSK